MNSQSEHSTARSAEASTVHTLVEALTVALYALDPFDQKVTISVVEKARDEGWDWLRRRSADTEPAKPNEHEPASVSPAAPQADDDAAEVSEEFSASRHGGMADAWIALCKEVKRLRAALAAPTPAAVPATLDVTLTQEELRGVWGFWDDDAEPEDEAVRLLTGPGHSGFGLYAAAPDYPEEGAVFIKALAPTPAPAQAAPEPWQEGVMSRLAFERGVSAMRDVAVSVIRARHESGNSCDPWKLVEAIRAAKEPTDPAASPAPSQQESGAAPAAVQPVARVSYSNWNGVNVEWTDGEGARPPVGTPLFLAAVQPVAAQSDTERDAARYRFLRSKKQLHLMTEDADFIMSSCLDGSEEVDALIDAAMSQAAGESK